MDLDTIWAVVWSVGLFKFMLNSFLMISTHKREFLLTSVIKNMFKISLHSDTYKLTSVKLGMIDMTELNILIPVDLYLKS